MLDVNLRYFLREPKIATIRLQMEIYIGFY